MAHNHKGKRYGGRAKGTPNKGSLKVEEMASKYKLHPFDVLMMIANDDWASLGYETSVLVSENADGATKLHYTITPEMRLKAASEANKYLLSQKKAVEISTADEGFKIEIVDYTSPIKK